MSNNASKQKTPPSFEQEKGNCFIWERDISHLGNWQLVLLQWMGQINWKVFSLLFFFSLLFCLLNNNWNQTWKQIINGDIVMCSKWKYLLYTLPQKNSIFTFFLVTLDRGQWPWIMSTEGNAPRSYFQSICVFFFFLDLDFTIGLDLDLNIAGFVNHGMLLGKSVYISEDRADGNPILAGLWQHMLYQLINKCTFLVLSFAFLHVAWSRKC